MMNHTFGKVLNFNEETYQAIDEAIRKLFQIYADTKAEYVKAIIHTPKNKVDIDKVQGDYLENFIYYGLALVDGGLHPYAVEMLLENAYEVFLGQCSGQERKRLRLQLLYVKKALLLLQMDVENYLSFSGQLASEELDLREMHQYFKLAPEKNNVKYVYARAAENTQDAPKSQEEIMRLLSGE